MRTSKDFNNIQVKDIKTGDLILASNGCGVVRLVLNVRWSTNVLFITWMIFDEHKVMKIVEWDYGKGNIREDSFRLLSRVTT